MGADEPPPPGGSRMVGRGFERQALAASLDDALQGVRHLVFVAGEPGAGKTCLAEAAMDEARRRGMTSALGRAVEEDGCPPYWPLLQVFRALGRRPPPGLADAAGEGRLPAGSSWARFRLFEVVEDDLLEAARPDGLLVVLDDLQWADTATVRFLTHLAAGVVPARLCLMVTYRDTETLAHETLRTALAGLGGGPRVTRLHLTGLSEPEVGDQLTAVVGRPVAANVVRTVFRRTGGNPFFVGELGRLLRAGTGGPLPAGVRHAVRDRLRRLSPGCRPVVSAAAVIGTDVEPLVVANVAGVRPDEVLAALDEATAAGILTGGPPWCFRHDLLRETARQELSTTTRLTFHRRTAEFLGARGDADAHVTEIARHHLESLPLGDAAAAVAWTERAADRAMRQLAWEEAAALYERALAVGDAGDLHTPADRCRLLLAAARAQVRILDLDGCREHLQAAVCLARDTDDLATLTSAALTMEGVHDPRWAQASRALSEELLARLPPADSPVRARLLAQAAIDDWAGDGRPGARSAEAMAMAERVGDAEALRAALRARQMARSGPDGVTERLSLGDRLMALGEGEGDDESVLWGRLWRFDALAQLGDVDGAEAETEAIRTVATRLRSPLATWHAARCQATIAAARGRFDAAVAQAREALAVGRRAESQAPHVPTRGLLFMIRQETGDVDALDPVASPGDPQVEGPVAAFQRLLLATRLLALGQPARARRVYRSLPLSTDLPPFVRLIAWAITAELAAEFDDPDTAVRMYRNLLPHAGLSVCSGAGVLTILGPVRYALGVAASACGRLDEAERQLRAALAESERAGTPPAAARAAFRLAQVLARRRRAGDRDEALALATRARTMADGMGMRPLYRLAAELAASLGGTRQGLLTRREHEIALLVAQGLTNRQIAGATHTGERTVETHVRHVLDKLGLANRTQIASAMTADQEFRTSSP